MLHPAGSTCSRGSPHQSGEGLRIGLRSAGLARSKCRARLLPDPCDRAARPARPCRDAASRVPALGVLTLASASSTQPRSPNVVCGTEPQKPVSTHLLVRSWRSPMRRPSSPMIDCCWAHQVRDVARCARLSNRSPRKRSAVTSAWMARDLLSTPSLVSKPVRLPRAVGRASGRLGCD